MQSARPALDAALRLHAAGDLGRAEAAYLDVLRRWPGDADATHLLAVVAHAQGRFDLAGERFRAALAAAPGHGVARCNYGAMLRDAGRPAEALAQLEDAVRLDPAHGLSRDNLGAVLQDLGRTAEALAHHARAVELLPGLARPLFNLGNAQAALGEDERAVACYRRALALEPRRSDVLNNLGAALLRLGHLDAATVALHDALAIDPGHSRGWLNLGQALARLHRLREAIACFDRADGSGLASFEADLGRGRAWLELGQPDEALACIDRALVARAGDPVALRTRANALYALGRLDDAAAACRALLDAAPDLPFLAGDLWHARAGACDWADRDALLARLRSGVERGLPVVAPFIARGLPWPPALQLACARVFTRQAVAAVQLPLAWLHKPAGERLRVGYLSSAFREHPTAMHVAGLFERHDRSAFEIVAIALDAGSAGPMRARIAAGVDRFLELGALTDDAVAATARSLGLDIAVDLDGTIQGARPGVFAARAAPLQVGFLGDPGTSGSDAIDYFVADRVVVEDSEEEAYSEKLVFMPDTYQVNDDQRAVAAPRPTRAAAGLPGDAFVYCCFSHARKITPEVFDAWMAILRQVDGSVMWLAEGPVGAADRLRRAARERGVDAGRLLFAAHLPAAEHRARCALGDLFLDTFDYTGHATTSDALWAGLPVLTRLGGSFAARVSASLLKATGLPELVTRSTAEFTDRAVALARDPGSLATLRRRLGTAPARLPLFDTARYARHLESAFQTMAARARGGQAPEHIHVEAT